MNIANIKRYAMRNIKEKPMAQQTAVEWLIKNFMLNGLIRLTKDEHNLYKELTDLAKQMEKEQINKAYYDGYYEEKLYDARSYYTDTYEK